MVRCEKCGEYNTGVYEKDGEFMFNKCGCPIPVEPKPTIRFMAIQSAMHPDYPLVKDRDAVR